MWLKSKCLGSALELQMRAREGSASGSPLTGSLSPLRIEG